LDADDAAEAAAGSAAAEGLDATVAAAGSDAAGLDD
jgi:hypothetical protein